MKEILATLPMAGFKEAIQARGTSLERASLADVAAHLRFLEPDELGSFRVAMPSKPSLPTKVVALGQDADVPIWGYVAGPELGEFSELWCRVRDDGFRAFKVLERVALGLEEEGAFTHAIKVVIPPLDIVKSLPLSEKFRALSFVVSGGFNVRDANPLWPLEANHEPSLLHVFVYDVFLDGTLQSLSEPNHPDRAALEELQSKCRDWLHDAEPSGLPFDDDPHAPLAGEELFSDQLWPNPVSLDSAAGIASLAAPDALTILIRPIRIVVVTSLVLCTENSDFAFASVAAAGRIYPHVMVKATHPLVSVDCSLQFERPPQTVTEDGAACACSEMLTEMRSLLTADSNKENMIFGVPGPAPMATWNSLFSYYLPDPFRAHGNFRMAMVRNDRTKRSTQGLVLRTLPEWQDSAHQDLLFIDPAKANLLAKESRQGAFDNLHIAPRMHYNKKVSRYQWLELSKAPVPGVGLHTVSWDPSMRAALRLDEIAMAPICAHDCFHLHWRWGTGFSDRFTWGFDGQIPYVKDGAPLVPENQQVWLRMRSDRAFTYHARSLAVSADTWVPVFHHGAAYALRASWKVEDVGKAMPDFVDGLTVNFWDGGLTVPDTTLTSWALFYWRLRYRAYAVQDADGAQHLEVEERGQVLDWQKVMDY